MVQRETPYEKVIMFVRHSLNYQKYSDQFILKENLAGSCLFDFFASSFHLPFSATGLYTSYSTTFMQLNDIENLSWWRFYFYNVTVSPYFDSKSPSLLARVIGRILRFPSSCPQMEISRSPLPQNNGNSTSPFFGDN